MLVQKSANETDVREIIICPLLSRLGYATGTENDVLREAELRLRYPRLYLGRKKGVKDPELIGRADYLLIVRGSARWILEVKRPSTDIDIDCIEQALSYARHPEVCAHYGALCNGARFCIFLSSQPANQAPLFDTKFDSIDQLASEITNILSPTAIRRDCTPRPIDLGRSLGSGLRSRVKITNGLISHSFCKVVCYDKLPPVGETLLQELERRLTGLQVSISNGTVERQDDGRIVALYIAHFPHELIKSSAMQKGFHCSKLIALSDSISSDPDKPTIFDFVAEIKFEGGEPLFDISSWSNKILEYGASMSIRGQCAGYINAGSTFIARHTVEYQINVETDIGIFTYDMFVSGDTTVNIINDF